MWLVQATADTLAPWYLPGLGLPGALLLTAFGWLAWAPPLAAWGNHSPRLRAVMILTLWSALIPVVPLVIAWPAALRKHPPYRDLPAHKRDRGQVWQ